MIDRILDKNVFFGQFMPISSPYSYDNQSQFYNPTKVIIDGQFNLEACEFG
jgi:hypothetical protein